MVEIRQVGLTTLMSDPAFEALSAEYAAEAAIDAIGRVSVQWPTYTALETAGLLRCFAAFEAGAKGMCVGAPPNGRLAQVLPSKGYQHSTSIYFRGLNA